MDGSRLPDTVPMVLRHVAIEGITNLRHNCMIPRMPIIPTSNPTDLEARVGIVDCRESKLRHLARYEKDIWPCIRKYVVDEA